MMTEYENAGPSPNNLRRAARISGNSGAQWALGTPSQHPERDAMQMQQSLGYQPQKAMDNLHSPSVTQFAASGARAHDDDQ